MLRVDVRGHAPEAAFLLACTAVVTLALTSSYSLGSYNQAADQHAESAEVTGVANGILVELLDAETIQRRYLITGDESLLGEYDRTISALPLLWSQLRELTANNPLESRLVDEIIPLINARLATLDQAVALLRAGERQMANDLVSTGRGAELMDEIRALMSELARIVDTRAESAEAAANDEVRQAKVLIALLAIVTAGLLAWGFHSLRRRGAVKSLRLTNQTKDEFIGLISHEMRTPMMVIAGNARMLRRRGASLAGEEQQQSLREIEEEGAQLQQVVENMLMLSRLDLGVAPDVEPLLVQRLVRQVVRHHFERDPESDLSVSAPELPPALGNPAFVSQVLLNLLSNAVKYAGRTAPIEVVASADDDRVQVAVADRGPGIEASRKAAIFEPFVRLPATSKIKPGAGLGLTVSRRLMRAQGGDIVVSDREGGGTVFSFWLRRAPAEGELASRLERAKSGR